METNVYKPPQSNLVRDEARDADFYVVSRKKFLTLFIATLGMYRLYWFYKNWSLYKTSSDKNMWPVMRAIFSIFFAHSLFDLLGGRSREIDNTYKWSPSGMATLYVIFTIIENITDKLSQKSIGAPYTDFVVLITLPLIGWSLYKAQLAANIACNDPTGSGNSRLTPANYVWIALGGIVWAVAGLGLYSIIFGAPKWN